MRRPWWVLVLLLALSAAVASAGSAGAGTSARAAAEPPPVASLAPYETAKLWRRLVATRSRRAGVTAECRPLRAVFYAATDFLRLATKLAASASPCAAYYISIPPLVSDKTQPRRDQAWRIRALGPNFHAMAEIHFATWTRWVASTGSSWYAAGVTARERMAAAGYDVSKGDTWALNELTSAVRRGTGNARANVREFLRPLRGRRHAADPGSRLRHRRRPADKRRLPVPDEPPELVRRLRLLGGHHHLRQRLVAGGVRRRPQLRRSRRGDVGSPADAARQASQGALDQGQPESHARNLEPGPLAALLEVVVAAAIGERAD